MSSESFDFANFLTQDLSEGPNRPEYAGVKVEVHYEREHPDHAEPLSTYLSGTLTREYTVSSYGLPTLYVDSNHRTSDPVVAGGVLGPAEVPGKIRVLTPPDEDERALIRDAMRAGYVFEREVAGRLDALGS